MSEANALLRGERATMISGGDVVWLCALLVLWSGFGVGCEPKIQKFESITEEVAVDDITCIVIYLYLPVATSVSQSVTNHSSTSPLHLHHEQHILVKQGA